MAKLTSERDIPCPCCGAVLTVDLNLGRVVSHEAPPNPDRPELDNAQKILAEQAARRDALFGNVVLSRLPIRQHLQHDLTWKTCEHRGVQRVDLAMDDDTLHFYNVHFGTSLLERRSQAAKLASIVHDRRVVGPKIVLGDFNEWARGLEKDILAERLQSIDLSKYLRRGGRSYPGFFPILHLDHIYYEGKVEVLKVSMPRDRMTLMASDHLPLVADLKIGFD